MLVAFTGRTGGQQWTEVEVPQLCVVRRGELRFAEHR